MKSLDRILQGFHFEHGSEEHLDRGNAGVIEKIESNADSGFPYLDPNPTIENYFATTNFSNKDRYDVDAPYNQAPEFSIKRGIGLPLAFNFDYEHFIKTNKGNNRETFEEGYDLPLYITVPKISKKDSYQWDSFPAGEAQQFLVFSVENETINSRSPYNGVTGGTVVLEAKSSSATERPYTISLSVTPYNAGPIPHIHWAEDEAFIMLQGEMDSWIGDPGGDRYKLYEFPKGNDVGGDNFPAKKNTKQLSADNVENYYYGHLMAEDGVYLPRGHAHAYRNASPNGDPLVFLTIWSRTPGKRYKEGGIEEFFTLSDPLLGRFYDSSDDAASYGNLYNKNIGSEESNSNQQRFVDYFNTFPEYYVAMSRNFGSFTGVKSDTITKEDGSALTFGGNWNPMIASDTGTFPTPPPAAWDESSETPWIATPNTEGTDNYYTPPAPNAPSEAVNFSTPFDPKIIQRIELTYNKSNSHDISKKDFNKISAELFRLLDDSNGTESTDLLQPKSNNSTSQILTIWDRFTSLDHLKESKSFKQIMRSLNKGGEVDIKNSSVDTDLASNYGDSAPQQMLLGKFELADGARSDVLKLSKQLKKEINKNEGDNESLSFDYYLEKGDKNTIYFIEHYAEGQYLASHLTKSYTAKFFEDFAPHLKSGDLADGAVSIYPVNTPESNIYIEQKNGINMFNEMLESMPDMEMTLSVSDTSPVEMIYVSNRSDTGGFGSFLEFSQTSTDKKEWSYGVIAVDNENGHLNGVEIGDPNEPNQDWLQEAASHTTILFETNPSFDEIEDLSRNIQVNTKSHYLPFRTRSGADSIFAKNGFAEDVVLEFPENDQLKLKDKTDTVLFKGMQARYGNVVQGMSTVTSHPQEKGFHVIDTNQQPRRTLFGTVDHTNSDGDTAELTLVKSNSKGKILDPLTGEHHPISSPNAQRSIAQMEADGLISYFQNSFELEGGSFYTPVLKKDDTYYSFANADSSIRGANTFEMVLDGSSNQFNFKFTHSEQMPLLS
ncbi:MAG: hypothetical protein VXX57_04145 [Cyanobacteriota bacterium]|nr:hypothetical protein [Cyanobacteriota bacterium]